MWYPYYTMEHKTELFTFLKSQNLMSLATFGDTISNCYIYFAIDEDFNMYFISEPDSTHCKNIAIHNQVACVVADSHQLVRSKKIGAHILGVVEDVSGIDRFEAILELWNSTNPGMESLISINNFRNKILNSRAYKIRPTEIKFFNEELYGEEGFEILSLDQSKK